VAHERYHIARPEAKEEEAHAHVHMTTGHDPHVLEEMLR
jgi:hypothetical protein